MKEGNWKPHGLNSDFGMQFLCYVSVYSIITQLSQVREVKEVKEVKEVEGRMFEP